ncbi:hypothetical protein HDU81_002657 [Chytriomyces hyalinus]|nr:hypothetical protein HDU81_002657 [Chytriomyces hyalinus]
MSLSLSNAVCSTDPASDTLRNCRISAANGTTLSGTHLIAQLAILLKLPQTATATAQTLFIRFFALTPSDGPETYPPNDVALACLFLAGKVEECNRPIRAIVNVYFALKIYLDSGKTAAGFVDIPLDTYNDYKDAIIRNETHILARLGFNVHVQHPHGFMVNYLQSLGLAANKELAQFCWNCLNDIIRTPVVVYYQPNVIACAAIYYGACKFSVVLPTSPPWWELFDATLEDVETVSAHWVALYQMRSFSKETLKA